MYEALLYTCILRENGFQTRCRCQKKKKNSCFNLLISASISSKHTPEKPRGPQVVEERLSSNPIDSPSPYAFLVGIKTSSVVGLGKS